MVFRIPPPPFLTGSQQARTPEGGGGNQQGGLSSGDLQRLNRWLIEIQSIFNAGGLIDPDQIAGLPELFTQVADNTTAIAVNAAAVAALNITVAGLQTQIDANTAAIAALDVRVTALEARNQILNGNGVPPGGLGNDGDLYLRNDGAVGTFLYGKIAGNWIDLT